MLRPKNSTNIFRTKKKKDFQGSSLKSCMAAGHNLDFAVLEIFLYVLGKDTRTLRQLPSLSLSRENRSATSCQTVKGEAGTAPRYFHGVQFLVAADEIRVFENPPEMIHEDMLFEIIGERPRDKPPQVPPGFEFLHVLRRNSEIPAFRPQVG